LVKKPSLDAMFTPCKNGYGYGWSIDRKFGQLRHVHAGGIPGFVTIIERFPTEKLLVVGLSNLETSRIDKIGDDLAAIALGEPVDVAHDPHSTQKLPKGVDTRKAPMPKDHP
jgi:hypothetical protein